MRLFSTILKSLRERQGESLSQRVFRGTFWAAASTVAAQGLNMLSMIFIARILGKEGFGEFGIVSSTILALGEFSSLGLGLTATKYIAEFRSSDPARAGRIIAFVVAFALFSSGVLALAFLLNAAWIAEHVANAPYLVGPLRLVAPLVFANSLIGVLTAALAGFEAFAVLAKVNLIRGLLTMTLVVGGTWLHGLSGGVLAMLVVAAANLLLLSRALSAVCRRFEVQVPARQFRAELPLLRSYSVPAYLSSVVVTPVLWLANTMLVHQQDGYAELGILNAANQWRNLMMFFPVVLGQALLPVLSNLLGERSALQFKRVLRLNLAVVLGLSLLLATLIQVFSRDIMLAYGPEFTQGHNVLDLVAIVTVISASTGVLGNALSSLGLMWSGFILNLFWAIAFIALAYFFVPQGALGIAMALLLSYLLHLLSIIFYGYFVLQKKVGLVLDDAGRART